ncbi:Uncharacterised protein [uncultured archaeon]|nr:Uncharacterised protein [uncultured archaeon]
MLIRADTGSMSMCTMSACRNWSILKHREIADWVEINIVVTNYPTFTLGYDNSQKYPYIVQKLFYR